jgi:hypothetical protein
MFIIKTPLKHMVLERRKLIMDLKQGGANGRSGLGAIGTNLGYRMDCKKVGKVYGCTNIRYG